MLCRHGAVSGCAHLRAAVQRAAEPNPQEGLAQAVGGRDAAERTHRYAQSMPLRTACPSPGLLDAWESPGVRDSCPMHPAPQLRLKAVVTRLTDALLAQAVRHCLLDPDRPHRPLPQ